MSLLNTQLPISARKTSNWIAWFKRRVTPSFKRSFPRPQLHPVPMCRPKNALMVSRTG